MKWSHCCDLRRNNAARNRSDWSFRRTVKGMNAVHCNAGAALWWKPPTGGHSSSPHSSLCLFPYLAIMRNKRGVSPLPRFVDSSLERLLVAGASTFPPRYSGLIPQWAQLRCRFPPRAPSPDTAVCRSPVGGAVQHAVSRAEWGERTGSCSVVTASPERRGEERREISLWSVAGVASALLLMSTVNAAMQGPGGATAAVQLLLSGIYA